jgi:lipid II:glycine glycyltransferase (peptidoglycan interpeptide bridge formation enzyme)
MDVISTRDARPLDDAAWDSFVAGSPDGHLMQTSRWGTLKAQFGWDVERVALVEGGTIIAGAQMLYRSLPSGLLSLAYVPMGPLVDWGNEEVVRTLMAALKQAAFRRHAFCLRMEPNLLDDPALSSRLLRRGLRLSSQNLQPRRTIVVDLDGDEEEILGRMKNKTRYKIGLSARKGVVIRDGTESDLPAFLRVMQQTAERDRFVVHSSQFYRAAYSLFVPRGDVRLLLAIYRGTVLAGIMAFVVGRRAWSIYGASGNVHRELMPNYLLQWESMRWARARGCLTYDLWGIPDEDEEVLEAEFLERAGGLWGVYRFKRGFGGRVVRLIGAYDDVYSRPLYWLYDRGGAFLERTWGETWHRRFRRG